ncbi:MAG: metallophosphoesterase [Candidatus Nanoarchaeia archaeon]|nr:metallophosphoesterase [Candidatus Nanoarchaeia archaeon]
MKLGVTGDIHSPLYFNLFSESLKKISCPDIMLLCGDIVKSNMHWEYKKVVDEIKNKGVNYIYSCFGNTEYDNSRGLYKKIDGVLFVDDELVNVEIENKRICLIGTRGALNKPTAWQMKNRKGIKRDYGDRIKKIEHLFEKASKTKYDYKILFMHYSPTYKTLKGEDEGRYDEMGCPDFEGVIKKFMPDVVFHAHSHYGTKYAEVYGTPVYNVSLPLNKEIKIIDLE